MLMAKKEIKKIADNIIDDFQKSQYKDKMSAINDYNEDNKNFLKLPINFLFETSKSNAHKELGLRLVKGYDKLTSDVKKQFKKDFFDQKERRCPFCGQLLETSGKANSDIPTADLDHFFPKSKYPQFALNTHNLIPICMECNRIEKHINSITPTEFKNALKELKLLTSFKNHTNFKLYDALQYNFNSKCIINEENINVKKLIKLYGLEQRYLNINNKLFNILLNILGHSNIRSFESLELLLENMASSNWHEINDGYSLNNSPQIWQEFIESILYDECKLMALWDEVKLF